MSEIEIELKIRILSSLKKIEDEIPIPVWDCITMSKESRTEILRQTAYIRELVTGKSRRKAEEEGKEK